jgi:methionyl-tRNA synthetase
MSRSRVCYHTTPIYYVNDVPHVGHAYTTLAADALTRARRLMGDRVFFLTGTDEHGQNIERIAREKAIPAQEYCDDIAARFAALWQKLDVIHDDFIRTTQERHKRGVVRFWNLLVKAQVPDGQPAIYRGKYTGWYCPRCESFKDESELTEPGHLCPDHERPCEWTEEENYFFRLSAYAAWLEDEITSGRLLVEPPSRRNEVLAVVNQGLKDFSVSRARVKWGIPVPGDPDHVLYVWVDALSNYITALGFAEDGELYKQFWEGGQERLHLIGKEIIRFHCLYWPAMLKAAGLPVPTRIFAHGWLTKGGRKLSKTTGNVIDTSTLIASHGVDAVRYFFLREGAFGQDWDFTDTAFDGRYNADLANDLGNLVSRAFTMAARYCDGRVPPQPAPLPAGSAPLGLEEDLADDARRAELVAQVLDRYDALDPAGALTVLWSWIGQLNQRIVVKAPWEVAKDPGRRAELDAFLYRLVEAIRIIATLTSPVMPRAAGRIASVLGVSAPQGPADLEWGLSLAGKPLGAIEPLFPRRETGKKTKEGRKVTETETSGQAQAGKPEASGASTGQDGLVDISEFARIDLRVAQVTSAEKIAGSKKLIRLMVDLGSETRQVVAGIAEAYDPESLVGRKIALVANLKPAKLMGVESNGMILAASLGGKPILCCFDGDVPVGTRIK